MHDEQQEPRYPINSPLRVAEVIDGQLPGVDAFYRVRGADLSRTGVTFLQIDLIDPESEVVFKLVVCQCRVY